MKKRLLIIIILVVIVSVLGILFYINKDMILKTPKYEKEKLKKAFISEGYTYYSKNNHYSKQIEESDGTGCGEQEKYSYSIDKNDFIRSRTTSFPHAPNSCFSYYEVYHVSTNISEYSLITTTINGMVTSVEEYNYDFNTGTTNCNNCPLLYKIKNDFIAIINKYDIDINKISTNR